MVRDGVAVPDRPGDCRVDGFLLRLDKRSSRSLSQMPSSQMAGRRGGSGASRKTTQRRGEDCPDNAGFTASRSTVPVLGLVWPLLSDPDGPVRCLVVQDPDGQLTGSRAAARSDSLATSAGVYNDDLFVVPGPRGSGAAARRIRLGQVGREQGGPPSSG